MFKVHHPQINLLPWRAAQRAERKRRFGLMVLGAVAVAVLGVVLLHLLMATEIDNQVVRNARVQQEINHLNAKIIKIKHLRKQKQNLLSRMAVIEQLQESRYLVVRLFDSINQLLPAGVVLERIRRKNQLIKISGYAGSNTRISDFLKNIEMSPLYSRPRLTEIKMKNEVHAEKHRFQIQVTQRIHHDKQQAAL